MDNVLIGQSTSSFNGTTASAVNTSDLQYGYYSVPLAIRNSYYPPPFPSLPSAQVNFALIDDEIPLALGDKIDYKDFIPVQNSAGKYNYCIVNPLTDSALDNDPKYKHLRKQENGGVSPALSNRRGGPLVLEIPRIMVSSTDVNAAMMEINGTTLPGLPSLVPIPIIILIVDNGSGVYEYPSVNIASSATISVKILAYDNALRTDINLAAYYEV